MSNKQFNSDSSLGRMAKNSAYIAFQFGLYAIAGFFFIPFLVEHYGKGSYGLIALAGILTQYVGIVSRCVGNAIARYLNIALNQNDWKQANEIFSTAIAANIGLFLLEAPLFLIGVWKLELLIDFPSEAATDFRILVVCNILVFLISVLSGVIRTPIQAANRLDVGAVLDSSRLLLRLFLLFSLISTLGAKLWIIGAVDLALSIVQLVVLLSLSRRFAKALRFRWRSVTRKWIGPVLNMAGWSVVTTLGGYLLISTDVWMINRFVSDEIAGVYAAMLVWPNFLKQVSKQLASILSPVYLIDYAKGNNERVARLCLSSAKLLGCFAALVVGVLYVIAEPVLELWLAGMGAHVTLFRIMLIYVVYTLGEGVLWQIYMTLNKVHFTGIVGLVAGIFNIILSLSLIHAGYGAIGVAVATAVSVFLACGVAIPVGVCRAFHMSYWVVVLNHVYATLLLVLAATAAKIVIQFLSFSIIAAIGAFTLLLIAGSILVYRLILSRDERTLILRIVDKLRPQMG